MGFRSYNYSSSKWPSWTIHLSDLTLFLLENYLWTDHGFYYLVDEELFPNTSEPDCSKYFFECLLFRVLRLDHTSSPVWYNFFTVWLNRPPLQSGGTPKKTLDWWNFPREKSEYSMETYQEILRPEITKCRYNAK